MKYLAQKFASNLDPQVTLLIVDDLLKNAKSEEEKKVLENAKKAIESNTLLSNYSQEKEKCDEEINKVKNSCQNILKLVDNAELVNKLKEDNALNYSYTQKHYPDVTEKDLNTLLVYAKKHFDFGLYGPSLQSLRVYHELNHKSFAEMSHKYQWGLLASYILMLHNGSSKKQATMQTYYEEASALLVEMRRSIDKNTYNAARVALNSVDEEESDYENDGEKGSKTEEEKSKEELNLEKSKAESQHMYRQLRDRLWLLHMSFFVLFAPVNFSGKHHKIYDFFCDEDSKTNTKNLSNRVMAVIETEAPYLIRYLFALYIVNRRRKNVYLDQFMKQLLEYVQNHSVMASIEEQYPELYENDKILAFIKALYIDVNFDLAIKLRDDVMEDVKQDYLLSRSSGEISQNMLSLILEHYLCVHKVIQIPAIAKQIGMKDMETEKRLVQIIRNARLSGKINSDQEIQMGDHMPNFYNHIVEKTERLTNPNALKQAIDQYESNENRRRHRYRSHHRD